MGFLQLRRAGATPLCGARASHCSGFSCCGARALSVRASVVVADRLSSCGSRASLLRSTWDLLGPGIEPVSPALAGGFLTTAPSGKSLCLTFGGTAKLFSKVAAPFYIPISSVGGLQFLHILTNTCYSKLSTLESERVHH